MTMAFDVVVIGAGTNGLTTAAYLAKRGSKVLVVERRESVGGLAAGLEFHPGHRSAGVLTDTTGVRPRVVEELSLERHGLRWLEHEADVLALGDDGEGLLLAGDDEAAAKSIARLSARDAERYLEYRSLLARLRPALSWFFDEPPVDLVNVAQMGFWGLLRRGLRIRRLGRGEMMELLRLPPMCVADWLDEWFETDLLKAALALPAIAGTFMGPWSPGTNANLLLREAAAGSGLTGGAPMLVEALEQAARGYGVEIRTGAAVEAISTSGSGVAGVELIGGETVEATAVAASCDPRQVFHRMLPPTALSHRLVERIGNFRARGSTAQVLLALDGELELQAAGSKATARARTGSHLDDLERAFDAIKYRTFADAPVLDIDVPSLATPGLAPDGHSVVSIVVHFAPYVLEPAWDDAQRERLGDRAIAVLERHAPGVGAKIVGRRVLAPPDLEHEYGLPGGHIHHGEHGLDQLLVRPVPECVGYGTPIPGLYLCGSGSHPGGGLTCAPGALAAAAIARAGLERARSRL